MTEVVNFLEMSTGEGGNSDTRTGTGVGVSTSMSSRKRMGMDENESQQQQQGQGQGSMVVAQLEERLTRVEETMKLILEWALDNTKLWKLRELAGKLRVGEESVFSLVSGGGGEQGYLASSKASGAGREPKTEPEVVVYVTDEYDCSYAAEPEDETDAHGECSISKNWNYPASPDLDAVDDDDRNSSDNLKSIADASTTVRESENDDVIVDTKKRSMNPVVRLIRITASTRSMSASPSSELGNSRARASNLNSPIDKQLLPEANLPHSGRPQQQYPCNQCEEVFSHRVTLLRHKQDVHNKATHGGVRERAVNDKQLGSSHRKVSGQVRNPSTDGKGSWTCKVCNRVFPTYRERCDHMKQEQHYKRLVECDLCNESLACRRDLLRHKWKVHKIGGPVKSYLTGTTGNWKCDICNNIFPTARALIGHRKKENHYKRPLSKSSTCSVCSSVFPTAKALIDHRKREGHQLLKRGAPKEARGAWNKCTHCDYEVYGHKKFAIHLRKHTGEKPFMCSMCGAFLKTDASLRSHNLLHTIEERSYICKYCGNAYKTANTLKLHENIHEGKADETCPHCHKTVANLRTHIASIHEKVRKFECHLCNHKFKRGCHLTRHLATHGNPNRRVKGYHIERPDKESPTPTKARKRTVTRMYEPKEQLEDEGEGPISN